MTTSTAAAAHPNGLAQAITGRRCVSYSQVSGYQRCSRQFQYRYVDHLVPECVPSSLAFGSAIHTAVQAQFEARMSGSKSPGIKGLLEAFQGGWRETIGDVPVRYNKDQDENSVRELADRMLRAFLAHGISKPRGEIIGIEEPILASIDPDLPDVLARIDLVTVTKSHVSVVDFKTAKYRWNGSKIIESKPQLALYGELAAPIAQDYRLPVRLHFAVLTKAKATAVNVDTLADDPDDLDRIKEAFGQAWHGIQAGVFVANPSPMNCTTCPYKTTCGVWR